MHSNAPPALRDRTYDAEAQRVFINDGSGAGSIALQPLINTTLNPESAIAIPTGLPFQPIKGTPAAAHG